LIIPAIARTSAAKPVRKLDDQRVVFTHNSDRSLTRERERVRERERERGGWERRTGEEQEMSSATVSPSPDDGETLDLAEQSSPSLLGGRHVWRKRRLESERCGERGEVEEDIPDLSKNETGPKDEGQGEEMRR
jgi:hypothetical protein